jgi:RecA/RadA recombinase
MSEKIIEDGEFDELDTDMKVSENELLAKIKLKNGTITDEKPKRARKSKISSQDLNDMSDKEFLEISDDDVQKLYGQFSSFIENNTDLKEDTGVKGIVPSNLKLLNAILGGGFALGTLNTIVGNPGCGKSMVVIQTLASAQKYFKRNVLVAFLDSEYSTTTIRLANLGVRYPEIRPFSESGTKLLTVEKFFQFLEGACQHKEEHNLIDVPYVIGWDSIANTLTQKEIESSDPKEVVGYRARVYSLLIPKYVAKCSQYNISILSVNQLRDQVDMGRFPKPSDLKFMSQEYTVPGGKALKFNAFHFLEMRQANMHKKEIEKYGFEGLMSEIMCVKNKLFRPKLPIRIIGDFNTGFSDFWTNYVYLVDNKWIEPGSWNTLINYSSKKFRTKEAEELYKTDKDFRQAYDEAVDSVIDEHIIKPNIVKFDDEEKVNV